MHFFDGFRTSHEINKVRPISDETINALIDEKAVRAHRLRSLSPDRPVLRGTAQNPDVFFQAREACNPYYLACPAIVQDVMDRFATAPAAATGSSTTSAHPTPSASSSSWAPAPAPSKRPSTR